MFMLLEKSATSYVGIAFSRHERQGRVDEAMRQRAELLVPHFRRAVTIGNVVNRRKVETEVLAETLDGLSSALFLVDANGQIKHANASGQAMLRAGLILSDTRGKLATADLEGDRVLKEVIAAAATGDAAAKRTGAALPLRARMATAT